MNQPVTLRRNFGLKPNIGLQVRCGAKTFVSSTCGHLTRLGILLPRKLDRKGRMSDGEVLRACQDQASYSRRLANILHDFQPTRHR